MINWGEMLTADPVKLANMMCYLANDCINCPVCGADGPEAFMNRKERVEKYGSFIYCPEREVLCMSMNNDEGVCSRGECVLDDPDYIRKEKEIEERYKARWLEKENKENQGEKERKNELQREIEKKKKEMERYYTRGRTSLGDKMSLEIAELERRMKK